MLEKLYQYLDRKIATTENELRAIKEFRPFAFASIIQSFKLLGLQIIKSISGIFILLVFDPQKSFDILKMPDSARGQALLAYSFEIHHNYHQKLRLFSFYGLSSVIAAVVIISLILSYIIPTQLPSSYAATFTKTWTSQADFDSNAVTGQGATTKTNVDTASSPGDVKLSTVGTDQTFTETFTGTTNIDTANSADSASGVSGGQLQLATGTATDLSAKLGSLWGNNIFSDNFDRIDSTSLGINWVERSSNIDIVGNKTKLLSRNTSDLAYTTGVTYPTADYSVQAVVNHNNTPTINITYLGVVGRRVNYGTDDSDGYYAFTHTLDTNGKTVSLFKRVSGNWGLLGGATPAFSNTADYTIRLSMQGSTIKLFRDGTEYVSVTDTSLTAAGDAGISAGQGGNIDVLWDNFTVDNLTYTGTQNALARASNGDIYVGADNGKFGKYTPGTDTFTDLTAKISGFWGTNVVNALTFDSANSVVYLGGAVGKFAKYTIATDTAIDLSSKGTGAWGTINIMSLTFDSINNAVYVGGGGAATQLSFSKCITTNACDGAGGNAINLDSVISVFWGTNNIMALIFNPANEIIYLGGNDGNFAAYTPATNSATNLTSKISVFWGAVKITKFALDSVNNILYLGGESGNKFAKCNIINPCDGANGSATDLTAKIPWSVNLIGGLAFDSTNQIIYISKDHTSSGFAKCRVINPCDGINGNATDLTSKIIGIGFSSVRNIIYDSTNQMIYLAGINGKFAKFSAVGTTQNIQSIAVDTLTTNIAYTTLTKNDTLGTDAWSQLTADGAAGSPARRYGHSSVWDSQNNRLLIFGGYSGTAFLNDLWSYTSTGGWTQLTADGAAGSPARRHSHSSVWDSQNNRFLMFGGYTGSVYLNDLWSYTSAGGWTQLTANGAAGSPTGRSNHSSVWDSQNNRLLMFGGIVGGASLNDLWSYTSAGGWSQLTADGAAGSPARRYGHSSVWDSQNNRLLIFGGYSGTAFLNDLWSYTSAGGWTQLTADGAAGSPARRYFHSSVWDSQNNRLLMFGGGTNDLWSYTSAGGWTQLTADGAAGSPARREAHSSVWDSQNNRLLMFGGLAGAAFLNDLWSYEKTGYVKYYLSNDNGTTFTQVTPGTKYNFATSGTALKWKATLVNNGFSPSVQDITIVYNGYNSTGTITNLKTDSIGDAQWTTIGWTASTPSGTLVKFRTRGATNAQGAGALTAAPWSPYYTTSGATITNESSVPNPTYRYVEIEMFLDSNSNGTYTPTVNDFTITYAQNGPPDFSAITGISQNNSDGKITVNFTVRDTDNNTGTTTPGKVNLSLEYCTNAPTCSTWSAATTVTGDIGLKQICDGNGGSGGLNCPLTQYTAYSITWTPATDYASQYSNSYKIRVKANDAEAINNLATAESNTFEFDTKPPVLGSPAVKIDGTTNNLTLSATDDNLQNPQKQMDIAVDCASLSGNWITYASPYDATSLIGAANPKTACVRFRDYYKNTTANTLTSTSSAPTNLLIQDTTNKAIGQYQMFISWGVVSSATKYHIYRSTDNFASRTEIGTIISPSAPNTNYFTDTNFSTTTTAANYFGNIFSYRITAEDANTNESPYSETKSGIPDGNTQSSEGGGTGGGGTQTGDTTPPAISSVNVKDITSTSAKITWTTNEISNSAVNYGFDLGMSNQEIVTSFVTIHEVLLTGLTPNRSYLYKVSSTDASNNTKIDNNSAQGYSFTTLKQETDIIAPKLFNVDIQSASTSAKIAWETDEDSSSYLDYGLAGKDYSKTLGKDETTKQHIINIIGLSPETDYHFTAYSFDKSKNRGASQDLSFKTLTISKDETVLDQLQKFLASGDQEAYNNLKKTIDAAAKNLPTPKIMGDLPKIETTSTTATITWTTDMASNSVVALASAGIYPVSSEEPYIMTVGDFEEKTTAHKVFIPNLAPSTLYHYQLRSKPIFGPEGRSNDLTFSTKSLAPEIFGEQIRKISQNQATIIWSTNIQGDSVIKYTPYRNSKLNITETKIQGKPDLVFDHEITLLSLEYGTLYDIEIQSTDKLNNAITKKLRPFSTNIDLEAPQISQIRTESAVVPGGREQVQTIIFWKTNEAATAQVIYQEGISEDKSKEKTTPEDANLTQNHVVVITSFKAGQVYRFKVKSKDSFGNAVESANFTILAPRQKESIIQIITKNFEETFGFLKKLKL